MWSNSSQILSLFQKQNTTTYGNIIFDFLDVQIKINQKSAIGDLFQECLTLLFTNCSAIFSITGTATVLPSKS